MKQNGATDEHLITCRMFLTCSTVLYGNGFVGSSYFDEIMKQVQDDGSQKGKGKDKC
jgi:hypothetical protein